MKSKRELEKEIARCEEAIDVYTQAKERLVMEIHLPATTLAQQKMNEYMIQDCKNYIRQYEHKIYDLRHQIAYPSKPPVNLYDQIWEGVLNEEEGSRFL
ncbi:hypothetical protein FC697_18510 [Bacillus wiedmannii]|uniref:hypothetical protein n=1 Tax=Bacillus wiedmannii TaxID=1890302 RepID=UPI0010BDF593|nr:hypothetical protein [Bacillus wiedmannii]TKH20279.1 hypothetical protein FC697_18510 [Bacillus wiedmannii]